MQEPEKRHFERLTVLWTQSQPMVAAYISTVLPDFHQTEEVLQRVAVALFRKFDQYEPDRPFLPWAIGVARFEVLRYRREFATDRHQFDSDIIDRVTDIYQQQGTNLAEWRGPLRKCVGGLAGRNQRILSLRYAQSLNANQIAKQMDMTAGAVRALLYRLRSVLKRCIERELAKGGRP